MAVKLYTTWWCGHCYRLKYQLHRAHIPYEEIDIENHPEVAQRIEEQTGGLRIVPTAEIGDQLLVNPTVAQIEATLEGAGVT
jgi:mycoredoxin